MTLLYRFRFLLTAIFLLSISSCCKQGDCRCDPGCNKEYWEYFIAHAGGAIDGVIYTNSLEAMELSYSKGCKLFELDLRLTTDDKLIAIHNEVNLNEAEFMSQLIAGQYTPMNMEAINDWFERHPDAILITDKINDPKRIYDEFLFPDRLIMELFTWEAVDEAIALGIKPMVSENLIFGKSEEPIEPKRVSNIEKVLKEKNITYICMSRSRIPSHKVFLNRMKKNGIKNYVFHLEEPVNGQPGEQYVWENEMDYCYGMYANDLDLLDTLLEKPLEK